MTFLIADDNAMMRASISRFLSSSIPNHPVILEAADGGEAIAVYERTQPDWVLMDIAMEPIDGLAATSSIMAVHPEAKIIIVTNYDDARYRAAAKVAGVRAYVMKEHLSELPSIVSAP